MDKTNKSKTIAIIIPAKGVSKRIPGKNLKLMAGKPLLTYILKTALKAKRALKAIDRVIVSTESPKVAAVARETGAEVPFIRPKKLTKDTTTSLEVLQHALAQLAKKENYHPAYVLLLYPTSPLLKLSRIKEVVNLALANDADSVFSGTYDKGHYWQKVKGSWQRLYPIKLVNSQYQAPLVKENGAIYLTKSSILKKQAVADKSDIVVMEEHENIDVDYLADFMAAEKILLNSKK